MFFSGRSDVRQKQSHLMSPYIETASVLSAYDMPRIVLSTRATTVTPPLPLRIEGSGLTRHRPLQKVLNTTCTAYCSGLMLRIGVMI